MLLRDFGAARVQSHHHASQPDTKGDRRAAMRRFLISLERDDTASLHGKVGALKAGLHLSLIHI